MAAQAVIEVNDAKVIPASQGVPPSPKTLNIILRKPKFYLKTPKVLHMTQEIHINTPKGTQKSYQGPSSTPSFPLGIN